MKNITSANSTFTVSHNTTILDAARRYAKRGCAITPIEFRAKKPILPGWQRGGVPEESFDEHFGSPPCNIGIVLGDPSNGLVDVDLDDPDAIPFADKLLPSTGCVFGRPSRPRSHRLYQVTSAGRKDASIVSGHTIVELRGNGHLTVFPGSIHPSGEVIQFDGGSVGDPGAVEWPDLEKAVCKIAIATLLFKKWVRGSRHPISLHAAGFLHNLGWTQTEAHDLIRLVATQAKDEEPFDRLESVKTTYEAAARGKPISGRRELVQLLGADAASAMEKWCGSAARRSSNSLSASDITSDAGAADAFADAKRDQLIFRDDTNLWFQKHRQVFRPISPVQAQGQAKEFMQERVASTGSWLATRSLLSKGKIDNLLTLSRHRFRVEPDLLDEARHLVGCADGMVLDLESQDIVPETTSIVTRMLRCPFAPEADCPQFEAFLRQVFADDDSVISFVQRAVGYSLSGVTTEQCFFLLVGRGSNGKSTFLNTLQNIFGDYAATTPAHTLMIDKKGNRQTDDLAKLVGTRFVVATETEKGQRLAESKIKRITGGDRIVCRDLYESLFEYVPQFKLWLATNDPPEFSGGDESIARRIRVIEFPVTFDEAKQDQQLPSRLLDEASGILNWALEGYVEWRRQGLNPPDPIKTATRSYRSENDSVGQFIEACCIEDPKARATAKELYEAYKSWCLNSEFEPIPNVTFGKELGRRGFRSIKGRSGNAWEGLKLQSLVTSMFS